MKVEKEVLGYKADGYPVDLDSLFRITVERNASISTLLWRTASYIRVNGDLIRMDMPNITPDVLKSYYIPSWISTRLKV